MTMVNSPCSMSGFAGLGAECPLANSPSIIGNRLSDRLDGQGDAGVVYVKASKFVRVV
jgi:hypothetical protein